MGEIKTDAAVRWYHQIPNWVMAAAIVMGGLWTGFGVYGQAVHDGPRIDSLEKIVGTNNDRLTKVEAHADDEAQRLARIENKIDQLMDEQSHARR